MGILYIENQSFWLDIKLIYLTVIAIISKEKALQSVTNILTDLNAQSQLIEVCKRKSQLFPFSPPGSNEIVKNR